MKRVRNLRPYHERELVQSMLKKLAKLALFNTMKCSHCQHSKYVKRSIDRSSPELINPYGTCLYCSVMDTTIPIRASDQHYCARHTSGQYLAENCLRPELYTLPLDPSSPHFHRLLALHDSHHGGEPTKIKIAYRMPQIID